jgi:hypothetical protein
VNARFSEYVTSGAFALTMTRTQIASLAMVAGGERGYLAAGSALERKGLVEAIPLAAEPNPMWQRADETALELRLTGAGALALGLLHQAGLTNGGADAAVQEIDSLRAELATARQIAQDANLRCRSLAARLDAALLDIDQLKCADEGERIPVRLTRRDPLPDATIDELLGKGFGE